ncbi:MAG: hypothetical protein EXS15_07990 [Phycisphaerales bacterium]|nr:hypothetical protein [Phycisphaerales bacterium]
MVALPPFLVHPIFRNRVWGGNRLGPWLAPTTTASDAYQRARTRGSVGEAWLVADLPPTTLEGKTRVASGGGSDETLADLLNNPLTRRALMGRALPRTVEGQLGFPLLLKVLDAAQNLSVQVHPSAQFSKSNPLMQEKSELWFVLDADEDALIYRGIRADISREQFAEHVQSNTLLDIMLSQPARRGDCIWLPSGVCHALGAGVLVAEVQTPSDTTFRIWDWGRQDPARPLRLDEAMECLLLGDDQRLDEFDMALPRPNVHGASISIEGLVKTKWFDVERWVVQPNTRLSHDGVGVPVVWTILEGALSAAPFSRPICRGSTIVLPAEHSGLDGSSGGDGVVILVTTLPDPLKNTVDFGGSRIA